MVNKCFYFIVYSESSSIISSILHSQQGISNPHGHQLTFHSGLTHKIILPQLPNRLYLLR